MIVPLVGTGVKSKSAVVNAQRRLNCYIEPQPDQDKTRIAVYGTPGLSAAVLDLGVNPCRGGLVDVNVIYGVWGSTFYEINNAFMATNRGSLATNAGRISMASNGTVIVIVDGVNGYTYDIATATLTQILDPDFPANPVTVTWQDGQFLVTFSEVGPVKQRVYISPDGTNWDALDFRAAESAPDALLRVLSEGQEVHCFGTATIEFWAYTGDADFPFAPIRGATLPVGLAARWSLAPAAQSLFFVGVSRVGSEVQVYELIGHQLKVISTPDLSNAISKYASKSDAVGFTTVVDDHIFYYLHFPTAGKTWMYDALTSEIVGVPSWSELSSGGGRHYSDIAFNLVNKTYVTDYRSGKVYRLDKDTFDDAGTAQEFELSTRHFFKDYDRVTVDEIVADFETGVGLANGQGSDPLAMLTVSRNSGRTFGNEMQLSIGKVGEYTKRVSARRLGTARDFVFKWRITDPVKRALTGFSVRATPGVN